MSEYVVKSGDTLWGIARSHGIRYWPNIYFATENNAFRSSHPNPDLIIPKEKMFIPSKSSITPMELHPVKVHRDIPLFTQSLDTCWRATGKMLYCRRYPSKTAEEDFNNLIGEEFLKMEKGLEFSRWHEFYCLHLGMAEAKIASPNELHYIIGSRGPAIVSIGAGSTTHSMVMAGYDLYKGRWLTLNPAAGEKLEFDDDVITVGPSITPSTADTGAARLKGYKSGPATWENMSKWLWILDTTIHEKIYYF